MHKIGLWIALTRHMFFNCLKIFKPSNVGARVAMLTFSSQISKLWPRFKLVGLKNLSWPFGFFWIHPMFAGLKKFVWPLFALFWPFTR